jgi:hypothetical protein
LYGLWRTAKEMQQANIIRPHNHEV